MNAHVLFASAHQPRPTAFCLGYSMQKCPASLSCYNGRRTGALYASVAPKPPRKTSAGSTKDAIDLHHNLHLQAGNSVISPNFSDVHLDLNNGAHIGAEVSPGIVVHSGDQMKPSTEQSPQAEQKHKDNVTIAGITLFLSLTVAVVMKYSPPGCWKYYLAGGICASTSHAITTPIDVVKTRQQVDPSLQEKSMWQATLAIIKTGGPFALLAGLGPTFIGYLIEGGVKFGIYEVSKPVTQRFISSIAAFFSNPALDSRILSLILCGFISGTAASLLLSPMEALRIRMVSDEEFSDKNLIDAWATMTKQEGIQSLLKGLPAMFWKQIPYTITKNASFDLFTTWLYRAWIAMGHTVTANMRIAIPLLSALAAAVLSCISSHPGDMLLSLVNAHEGSKRTRDFAKDIMNGKDGIKGFFVGIKPRFVHVLMIVTVQLMIYDFVKRLVGIAATGMG
ncbi:hypothetical protein ACHAWO_008348 [Cyclotella atomus]|uniref:Mitochondrial carrier protein n=1 Tax=Cyclotella atomus TaxID=382360 RepID=A0ABD3N6Q7_9STRA